MDRTKLMEPVELSDYELDAVAAGSGCRKEDGGDNNTFQIGLINADDGSQAGLVNVNVG